MELKPYFAQHSDGSMEKGYGFWCPGCFGIHHYRTQAPTTICPWRPDRRWPVWVFNGNHALPSFTPSLLMHSGAGQWVDDVWVPTEPKTVFCHMYLTDGVLRYLGDCAHHLKGVNVPLADVPGDHEGQALYRIEHQGV